MGHDQGPHFMTQVLNPQDSEQDSRVRSRPTDTGSRDLGHISGNEARLCGSEQPISLAADRVGVSHPAVAKTPSIQYSNSQDVVSHVASHTAAMIAGTSSACATHT